jgi:hypothetical protein
MPGSAPAWPTTWAWARPCRRWRCCCARALGPALVVAPTSVCANWVAEAHASRRRCGRSTATANARGAARAGRRRDLVIVSYALAQRDIEALPRALGDAGARRSAGAEERRHAARRSVAALQAGFRLALTGTPVENRLADLWSLMNLLNPGLLGSARASPSASATPIERDARRRRAAAPAPPGLALPAAPDQGPGADRPAAAHRDRPPRRARAEERAFLEAMRATRGDRVCAARRRSSGKAGRLPRAGRADAAAPRRLRPAPGGARAGPGRRQGAGSSSGWPRAGRGRHKALVFSQFTDFLKLLASACAPPASPTSTSTAARRRRRAPSAWPRSSAARATCS